MSKSVPAGCVALLDPLRAIEKKIKSAVTDSGTEIRFDPERKPGVANLLTILAAFSGRTVDQVQADLAGQMYGALKKATAEAVLSFAEPFQERVGPLMADPAELDRLMAAGAVEPARSRRSRWPTSMTGGVRGPAMSGGRRRRGQVLVDVVDPQAADAGRSRSAWRCRYLSRSSASSAPTGSGSATRWPTRSSRTSRSVAADPIADESRWRRSLEHLRRWPARCARSSSSLAGSETFRPVSPVVFVPLVAGRGADPRDRGGRAAGPARPTAAVPVPPARHGGPSDLAEEWLDQAATAMATYRAAFEVCCLGLFVQGVDGVWRLRAEFAFGGAV